MNIEFYSTGAITQIRNIRVTFIAVTFSFKRVVQLIDEVCV